MATEIKMPQLGLTMEEGTVERWLKAEGDAVKAGEPLLEITTDKLTNEVEAETDGVLLKIVAPEGTDVPVQGLLGYIGQPGEQVGEPAPAAPAAPAAAPAQLPPRPHRLRRQFRPETGKSASSPLARKIARQMGVDYTAVAGTGPSGRIIKRDILAAAEAAPKAAPAAQKAAATAAAPTGTAFPVKNLELMEGDTVEKLTGMRKVVAQRMYTSAVEIPTVTQTVKIDVTALLAFRKQLKEAGHPVLCQ